MQIVEVATGTFWLEVPEADLRVLCGCPADSVKHLMKRGLIRRVTRDGVTFETGPNAVLLSDVALQGGEFCNLSEFPVLQMLYRQGMILPGHPNNDGAKPMLIGLREQIAAQMEYIRRGNYGLVSEEELREAQVPPDIAADWMAVKLRFAFGSIRGPDDLLTRMPLGDAPLEIRGGVTLRRLDMNVFEFRHGDDTAIVDLNLDHGQHYAPPFSLGYHSLRREYFAVVHSGEGDGWDPNRPSMSSILMFQGRIFLIDAGPNLHAVLGALGIGIHEVDGLFHTHCHDDHFAGLTTLVRADHRVRYYATPAVRASVSKKLAALMGADESAFKDYFDVQDLDWDTWNDIEGLEVKPIFSPHPVENSIFVFRTLWEDGWRSYAHYADIASFRVLDQMAANGVPSDLIAKVKRDYLLPSDLKKIDIGGGLIHGHADDFADDDSGKIILAHTAMQLTPKQKEIGSGAAFGTSDVLVPALQDYGMRFAHSYLLAYFPEVPAHQLRILLNHPVRLINPETILIREGRPCYTVYLILSGTVEAISGGRRRSAIMTAGAVIGELAALNETPSRETVRAQGFVRVLCLPTVLYRTFVARNGLADRIVRMADMRRFFNNTWLLGENLSAHVHNRIAGRTQETIFADGGEIVIQGADRMLIVREGAIEKLLDGNVVDRVEAGGHVGVAEVLFSGRSFFRYRAAGRTVVLAVPGGMLREIPITRLKMVEDYQRRMARMFTPREEEQAFPWMHDYATGIPGMDRQHQRLFDLASLVVEAARSGEKDRLIAVLDDMLSFTRQHFGDEERLMSDTGYPQLPEHARIHATLLDEMVRVRQGCQEKSADDHDFHHFFQTWIISHIFKDDSRYARYIVERGDYVA
ncbi:MAG: bacteriohemerythrin [Alphaproteobacteria bacterium]|nr:bacteriohemerythrin [Alphaproteobacteria bacterium]